MNLRPSDGSSREREQPRHLAAPAPSSVRLRTAMEIPALVLVALVVTLLVKAFLAQAFFIPSASMEPQLMIHDRVIVSRTAYRLHDPHRGDIVVFPSPAAPPRHPSLIGGLVDDLLDTVALGDKSDDELIKRVIGLPGDVVEGKDGGIVIDGRTLTEPYIPKGVVTDDFGPIKVPKGRVFVMGDNRGNSHDSRFSDIGPIKISSIVGRAIGRVWPPGRTAFL